MELQLFLKNFIDDNKEDLTNYGSVENLGSHSILKRAYFYCSGCGTMSPSTVSIFLCEGWTISGAKERNLKYENAVDKLVS